MKYLLSICLMFLTYAAQALEINDSSITHGYLENGMRYIIKPNVDEGDDQVYFALMVKTGSYNEDDDQRGYAHVLEHAMFRSQTAIDDPFTFFSEKGGAVNAITSFHDTVYFPSVRKENEQYALDFLSDIATQFNVDEAGLKLDQEIVLNEFNTSSNPHVQTSPYINNYYLDRSDRYLKRLPIGTKTSLLDIKLNRLKDFYQSWYHPSNMTLFVIGDVDADLLLKQITQSFGGINKTGALADDLPIITPRKTTYNSGFNEDENFLFQEFVFNANADKSKQKMDYLKNLLIKILIKDDLDSIVKKYDVPFSQTFTQFLDFGFGQLNAFKIELSDIDSSEELETTLMFLEQYKLKITQDGFSDDAIENALLQIQSDMELLVNDPSMKKNNVLFYSYLQQFIEDSEIYPLDEVLLKVVELKENISNDQIKNTLQMFFESNVETMIVFDSGSIIRRNKIEEWQVQAKELFEKEGLVLNEKTVEEISYYNIPKANEFDSEIKQESSDFLENPVQSWTLGNGVTVNYIYQPNDAKQTYMMFMSDVQAYDLPSDLRVPLVNFTQVQLMSGLNGLSIEEIGKEFTSKKMGVQSIQESTAFYGLSQINEIDELASYMHRMLAEPIMPNEITLNIIDNTKKQYASNQQSFSWLSEKNRTDYLFQGSPYLSAVTGEVAENLTVENIEKIRRLVLSKNSHPTIILTGELSKEEAIRLSEKYFSTIATNDDFKPLKQSPINDLPLPEAGRFNIGFNEIQYDNVVIYYTSKSLVKNDKNVDQAKLFNYLFATFMFDELREKRGLVYTPSTTYQFNDDSLPFGFFYVSFQADVLNEDEFYAIVDEVTDSFFEQEIDLETLERAKKALTVEVQAQLLPTTILNVFLNKFQDDFSFDLYYEQKGVDALSLQEANEFKQKVKDEYVRSIYTTYPR